MKLNIVYVPLADLKPAEYNPRQMTDSEAMQLKNSLDEFGMVEPIVVNSAENRKNIIIGGHQRYNILKLKGELEVPVVYVDIPDEVKERELNLRLNKNNGSWDWDKLASFDTSLLESIGFDPNELASKFDIMENKEIIEFEARKRRHLCPNCGHRW